MKLRPAIAQLHLWLGLSLGGLFALLGLTGSALVFYTAIDAALNPAIRVASAAPAPGWESPVWDQALATVRARWPEREGSWRFEVTGEPGALPARYRPPGGGHHSQWVLVWLSPDGRSVLREARWGDTLMTWIYDLHIELLAGDTGQALVGWSGLVLLVLLLSGLAVWWPRGRWRQALAYKRDAARSRRLRDIHKLAGLAGLPLLLMLVGTGVMLALPDESNAVLAHTLGPVAQAQAPKVQREAQPTITVQQALNTARTAFPQARLAWVEAPGPAQGVFLVRVQQASDPSARFPHSHAWVHPHTGALLKVHDREQQGASNTVNNWLHPLHDGSAGGLPLRALLVVAGLVPAALFITGLWRWQLLRRARRLGPAGPGPDGS